MKNRYAAIDIGTNGVRLLLASAGFSGGGLEVRKDSSVRIPIRLGDDVFTTGKISREKEESLMQTMLGFFHLIRAYEPIRFRSVATSAMREASNASEIIKKIYRKAGIRIETLSGLEEARTIYSAHTGAEKTTRPCVLVDVGGGSTEIVFFRYNEIIDYKSFNIGTVRNLRGREKDSDLGELKSWLREVRPQSRNAMAIGTGGNINRVWKILNSKKQPMIKYDDMKSLYTKLKPLTIEERILRFKLKEDRADVILPAMNIYLSIMKQLSLKSISVPGIGLADGLIYEMAASQDNIFS